MVNTTSAIDRYSPFPATLETEGGNAGVETGEIMGEWSSSGEHGDAGDYTVDVGFSSMGHVTLNTVFDNEVSHVGALTRLSPDTARELAALLEGLADYVEAEYHE